MRQLNTEIKLVSSLSEGEIQDMYHLYVQYYAACERPQFDSDLTEKKYVVLLRGGDDILRGFSTLVVLDFTFKQKRRRAIYSGDTVIHHDYWGSQSLSLAWSHLAGSLKLEAPSIPLYWLLIVKGHRTYRYLSLFAKRFYPTWRHGTPKETQDLMDYLARYKFGDAFKPDEGIIRFEQSRGHLKGSWADVPEHLLKKPDVRFFLDRNPRYQQGDELVCLTELCEENLRSHALRAFTDAMQHD